MLLLLQDLYQSLVEHFERWADASGQHGLCILEAQTYSEDASLSLHSAQTVDIRRLLGCHCILGQAMLLDVPNTVKYFDENAPCAALESQFRVIYRKDIVQFLGGVDLFDPVRATLHSEGHFGVSGKWSRSHLLQVVGDRREQV